MKRVSEDYNNYLQRQYDEFINYSQLPKYLFARPPMMLPKKLSTLYENIHEFVQDRYNLVFKLHDYTNIDVLCAMLLNKYYNDCINMDKLVESILYIDVGILMYDYKKLMDMDSEGVGPQLTYPKTVLYEHVENATMVIWDKLSSISSNYEKQKLMDILAIRKRKKLGNIYFIKDYDSTLNTIMTDDLAEVLDVTLLINCEHELLQY